eukprot:329677-Chlamydomonas_euryale.AAC.9
MAWASTPSAGVRDSLGRHTLGARAIPAIPNPCTLPCVAVARRGARRVRRPAVLHVEVHSADGGFAPPTPADARTAAPAPAATAAGAAAAAAAAGAGCPASGAATAAAAGAGGGAASKGSGASRVHCQDARHHGRQGAALGVAEVGPPRRHVPRPQAETAMTTVGVRWKRPRTLLQNGTVCGEEGPVSLTCVSTSRFALWRGARQRGLVAWPQAAVRVGRRSLTAHMSTPRSHTSCPVATRRTRLSNATMQQRCPLLCTAHQSLGVTQSDTMQGEPDVSTVGHIFVATFLWAHVGACLGTNTPMLLPARGLLPAQGLLPGRAFGSPPGAN